MSIKITLTPEAIDRLLESDPETALEIKQGIAAEFAKRYLKDVVTGGLEIVANDAKSEAVRDFLNDYVYEWKNGSKVFRKDVVENIKRQVNKITQEEIDNTFFNHIVEQQKKSKERWDEYLKLAMDDLMCRFEKHAFTQYYDAILDRIAEKALEKMMEKK